MIAQLFAKFRAPDRGPTITEALPTMSRQQRLWPQVSRRINALPLADRLLAIQRFRTLCNSDYSDADVVAGMSCG